MKNYSFLLIILSILVINSSVPAQGQNWKKEISSNYFYIKSAVSDKCWDLPGKHPNTAKRDVQFQMYDNDKDKYEKTFIFPAVSGTEYYAIKNLAGYIVDVAGKDKLDLKEKLQQKTGKKFKMKTDNGMEIQTWEEKNNAVAAWQQWRLIVVDKNTVIFENAFTHKAINISGNGDEIKANRAKLVSWDRNNKDSQRFQLIYADGPNAGQPLDFEK